MVVRITQISRHLAHLLLVGLILGRAVVTAGAAEEVGAETLRTALGQAYSWMQTHPPDPKGEKIGSLTLDVWAWDRFAAFHPQQSIRKAAAEQVRQRLLTLPPPGEPSPVHLTYWAVLLRLLDVHGVDRLDYRHAAAGVDLDMALLKFKPTTVWWTRRLLAFSGLDAKPDFSPTFIARQAVTAEDSFTPSLANVYQVFHELVPATDLGRLPLQLTRDQKAFVVRALPALLRAARAKGDTDAVAEALISAALVGMRDSPAYRQHIAWLLSRQRTDGAFESHRDAGRTQAAAHYRHVMVVANWALMTALPSAAADLPAAAAARPER
jgi:hypothetical protein